MREHEAFVCRAVQLTSKVQTWGQLFFLLSSSRLLIATLLGWLGKLNSLQSRIYIIREVDDDIIRWTLNFLAIAIPRTSLAEFQFCCTAITAASLQQQASILLWCCLCNSPMAHHWHGWHQVLTEHRQFTNYCTIWFTSNRLWHVTYLDFTKWSNARLGTGIFIQNTNTLHIEVRF